MMLMRPEGEKPGAATRGGTTSLPVPDVSSKHCQDTAESADIVWF